MATLSASISLEIEEPTVFERFLALYAGIGCGGLQGIWRSPINPSVQELIRSATLAGLNFDSVHGSFGPDFDVSAPDESIRLRTLITHEQDAELAGALGGTLVVVHPSCIIPSTENLDWSDRNTKSRSGAKPTAWGAAVDRIREPFLLDSLEKLAGIGEEMEIVFALENVPGYLWYGNHAQHLATLVRQIDSPYVQMCFDTGHAHLEAEHYGSVAAQLAACLDVVGYVHFHDNDGAHDIHLIPGIAGGTINWEEVGEVLRDSSSDLVWMLELFGTIDELEKSFGNDPALHEKLRVLFNS